MKLNNKFKEFSTSSIMILLVIGILIFVNLLSAYIFGRLDLTAEKRYTISSATKKIISQLDDPVIITLYASKKLPADFQSIAQYTNDILSEYQAYSGKIKIKTIDPGENEELIKQAQTQGVPQIEMQVMEKDEFKVQKGFFGLSLMYGDKKEAIPILSQVENLEFELTAKIIKLTASEQKAVGFLTGHNEHSLEASAEKADYNTIKSELEKIYLTKTIDLSQENALAKIDTLVIAGPDKALTDDELLQIDQYILKGGKVIFLTDNTQVGLDMQAKANHTGLEKLLENYGIKLEDNLVADNSSNVVAFNAGQMQFLINYPYWPKLLAENFAKNNPIFSKLQTISFPWLGSLTALQKENTTINILATTSNLSAKLVAPYNLDPQNMPQIKAEGKIPLIAEAVGKFKTAFPDKENITKESVSESKIIAIPDADFISDSYLQRFPSNSNFILNTIDYLTLDESLMSIRAKSLVDRPIKTLSANTKTAIKVINIGVIPILIIALGVIKYIMRKKTK